MKQLALLTLVFLPVGCGLLSPPQDSPPFVHPPMTANSTASPPWSPQAELDSSGICPPIVEGSKVRSSTPPSGISQTMIEGKWFGAEKDAEKGPISYCGLHPRALLIIKQVGNRITAELEQGEFIGNGVFFNKEVFLGTYIDSHLAMTSEETIPKRDDDPKPSVKVQNKYDLRFNNDTEHFEGTRNGSPIFLVPVVFPSCALAPPPGPCDPVP